MYLDAFTFGVAQDHEAVRLARIPAGVDTKEALLQVLDVELSFPGYFGFNWDALAECLRDLSWLPPGRVVLVHEALPDIGEANLALYIETLEWAVRKWRGNSERILDIRFPADAVDVVALLLLR